MKYLVLHIGTGKTGSTSIQKFLKTNLKQLNVDGIYYWGINLEHAPLETEFAWQKADGIGILQRMARVKAQQEVHDALGEALNSLPEGSVAIWSNESVYELYDLYIPVLTSYQQRGGLELRIVAYARNTRDYIASAYKQWGIKHKMYKGPILGFSEWVSRNQRFLSFGKSLNEWDQAFSDSFSLRNYDVIPDVVEDFIRLVPVKHSCTVKDTANKANRSPTDMALALYALYNNQFSEPILPSTISSLLSRYRIEVGDNRIGALTNLFPSARDLSEAEGLFKEDTMLFNQILSRNKQPQLSIHQESEESDQMDDQDIVNGVMALLLTFAVKQDAKMSILEQQLESLKTKPNN